jgi:hypothetical protein
MKPMDAGLEAVALIREILEPEGARTLDEARGFAWWPHAHMQRVWAEPARPDGACVVASETVLLAEVPGRGAEFAKLALRNAREPGLSSLRWDSQTQQVSMRAAVVARPGDGNAAARRLSHAALLQIGEALRAADSLAVEMPGSTLVTPPPPVAGQAAVVAQVEAWRAFAEGGAPLAEQITNDVAALMNIAPAPWLRVTRAAHGLDAEILCVPPHQASAPGEGVALLRVSASQPHPQLGPGLVFVLVPPPDTEPMLERAPATAALLNEAEAREWTGADQLGGWCVHPSVGLAHVSFVPAMAVEDDTAQVLAWQAGTRARWVRGFLASVAARRKPEAGPTGG